MLVKLIVTSGTAGIGLACLCLPSDRVGFRFDLKAGPQLSSHIGVGLLSKMRDYNPEFFAEANIDVCLKLAVKASTLRREFLWFWGDEIEHPIYQRSFSLMHRKWNLFPDYTHSSATATTTKAQTVKADVATAVAEPTPTDIETGFELLDSKGDVVDSVFVGTIHSEPEVVSKPQTFNTERTLPATIKQENLEGYTMRPIFHYAGYTISAAPVGIKKDVLLQPYSSTQSNGAMTFISSGPFLGSATEDGTLYQLGVYLPVPLKKNVYKTAVAAVPVAVPIDESHEDMLMGTWKGTMDEQEITLVFKEDGTGTYNDMPFVYEVNVPQSGTLLLIFKNEETTVYRVVAISETIMQLMDKRDKQQRMIELEKTKADE